MIICTASLGASAIGVAFGQGIAPAPVVTGASSVTKVVHIKDAEAGAKPNHQYQQQLPDVGVNPFTGASAKYNSKTVERELAEKDSQIAAARASEAKALVDLKKAQKELKAVGGDTLNTGPTRVKTTRPSPTKQRAQPVAPAQQGAQIAPAISNVVVASAVAPAIPESLRQHSALVGTLQIGEDAVSMIERNGVVTLSPINPAAPMLNQTVSSIGVDTRTKPQALTVNSGSPGNVQSAKPDAIPSIGQNGFGAK